MRIFSQKDFSKKGFLFGLACLGILGACTSYSDNEKKATDLFSVDAEAPKPEEPKKTENPAKSAKKPVPKKEVATETIKKLVTNKAEAAPKPEQEQPVEPKAKTLSETDKLKTIEINKIYKIGWLKFDVAKFVASTTIKEDEYVFRFYSQSMGFVDKLANFAWGSVTRMKLVNGEFVPISVDRIAELKKSSRHIVLKYDPKGTIVSDVTEPPENRGKRPEVSAADKAGTMDALTLVMQARAEIIDAYKANKFASGDTRNFTHALYDGRKRSDIILEVKASKTSTNLLVRIRQQAVSGYTNNELKDLKQGDRYIDIVVDTVNFLPISGSGKSPVGSARANYLSDCTKAFEECVKDIEANK